jgi:predicted cupin superfamily sugar epimerase
MSLIETLGLQAHPEGGWFAETWRAPVEFSPAGYPGPRAAATAITFLLRAGEESRWHRVRSDELWLWQGLGPLRLRLGGSGPTPSLASELPDRRNDQETRELVVGPAPDHLLQGLVPAGVWQAAVPLTDAGALVACVVAPGFAYEDFELG